MDAYTIDEILSMARGNQDLPNLRDVHIRERLASTTAFFEKRIQDIGVRSEMISKQIEQHPLEMNKQGEMLSQFTQEIQELGARSKQLQTGISAIESLTSPAQHLPMDVMEEVFSYLVSYTNGDGIPEGNARVSLLSGVCWRWYQTAKSMPQMWSTIILTSANRSTLPIPRLKAGIRHLEICISRSNNVPIKLYVRAEFLLDFLSFALIKHAAHRIIHLAVIYPMDVNSIVLPPSHQLTLPVFELGKLSQFWAVPTDNRSLFAHMIRSSPDIRSITYACSSGLLQEKPPVLNHWSKLEVLHLEEPVSLPLCLLILRCSPAFRQLSLTDFSCILSVNNQELMVALTKPDALDPFTHSNLCTLSLGYIFMPPERLLDLLTLPNLQNLVLAGDNNGWSHDIFVRFLERSQCQLTHLELHRQYILAHQLLQCIALPSCRESLETLIVWPAPIMGFVLEDDFFESLTVPSNTSDLTSETIRSGPSILCPKLQILSLGFHISLSSARKLVNMLLSRLNTFQGRGTNLKSLKLLGIPRRWEDNVPGLTRSLGIMCDRGLVAVKWNAEGPSGMLDPEQKEALRKHLSAGVDMKLFRHGIGEWLSVEDMFLV